MRMYCVYLPDLLVYEARKILLTFLTTEFEGGRHERRIKNKIRLKIICFI